MGKRRVPEFLCPIKYRTGLPDHTAACLPPLHACPLPSLSTSTLVAYRPTALESSDTFEATAVFDPLFLAGGRLCDFVDLSVFRAVPVSQEKEKDKDVVMEEPLPVPVPVRVRHVKPIEKRQEQTIISTTELTVSPTTHSLVSFDHEPHLSAASLINMSSGDGTAVIESEDHRLTEYEARPLGATEHDYFVVVGDTVYPIGARLQLRRRR